MLIKVFGYIITAIGFVGFGYFKNYHGTIIPLPTLWFIVSIALFILGLCLIANSHSKKTTKQEKYNKDRVNILKKNAEKILLTIDNCEIRENNYHEEVINENSSRIEQIDAVYNANRNYKQ